MTSRPMLPAAPVTSTRRLVVSNVVMVKVLKFSAPIPSHPDPEQEDGRANGSGHEQYRPEIGVERLISYRTACQQPEEPQNHDGKDRPKPVAHTALMMMKTPTAAR